MKMICNGSGSFGNGYLITNGKETLILECGTRFIECKKALNFDISSIVGLVSSHVHSDHFRWHEEYENAGIKTYYPFVNLGDADISIKACRFGGFYCQAFPLVHSVECYGFYITHKELGKLLFITDTEYVPQNFSKIGVNHILVEANYDKNLIDSEQKSFNHSLTGHMEIETTLDFVMANITDSLKTVLLCHLSGRNADSEDFLERLNKIVPTGVRTAIAEKGVKIEL